MTKDQSIKNAAYARNYGASELMLATMTGKYPPPHREMDEREAHRSCPKLRWVKYSGPTVTGRFTFNHEDWK